MGGVAQRQPLRSPQSIFFLFNVDVVTLCTTEWGSHVCSYFNEK